jgi:endonuclease-3
MVKRTMSTAKPSVKELVRKRGTGRGRARISASEVVARLEAEAPLPAWRPHRDPLGELTLTLLSQNTSDTNSGRAYQQLLGRYASWDAVIAAPVQEVEATIRVGGLAKTKAPRMQALLSQVRSELGPGWSTAVLSERLAAMSIEDAKSWLTALPGIGPKTAACVLLFSEGRPALPVDTHVQRVSQRLGLIGPKVGAVEAHTALEALLPPKSYYAFHVAMIRHGRRVCKAQRPVCESCVLSDECPIFLTQ